jgi:hypothetical protein
MVEESCWLRGFGVVGTILGINVSLLGILHLSVTELYGEGRYSHLPTYVLWPGLSQPEEN